MSMFKCSKNISSHGTQTDLFYDAFKQNSLSATRQKLSINFSVNVWTCTQKKKKSTLPSLRLFISVTLFL